MAGLSAGDAIFSTHLGQFPPRGAGVLPARIILRSSPEIDMEAEIAELQAEYPSQCKAIDSPITNVYKYFDDYDQELHGERFLHTVLTQIFERNVLRRQRVLEYAQAWMALNPAASQHIHEYKLNAFTDDDVEEYGEDFLREVLEVLQVAKAVQDNATERANEIAFLLTQERFPHASTAQFPAFPPPEQRPFPYAQRNVSAPTTLYSPFGQPASTASIPSATLEVSQVNLPRPPIQQPLHPVDAAGSRPLERLFRSAPLPFASRVTHYSDPIDSGVIVPRDGYPDSNVAIPPPAVAGGSYSMHRMPAGPRTMYYPANTMRNPPKSRAPIYMGPSNDARVLEKEGVPKHRGSVGEGRVGRGKQPTYGQQMPQSKPYPPFQQSYPSGAPPNFSQQGPGYPVVGPNDVPHRVLSSDIDRPPTTTEQDSNRRNHKAALRPLLDGMNGPQERQLAFPAQLSTTPPRQGRDTFQRSRFPDVNGTPDTTPPHLVHRDFDAAPINSPTPHRFSNASTRPFRATSRTHKGGEQQTTPNSRGNRSDWDEALCDRNVWIGGLRPDAKIEILAGLLGPWGPVSLSGIKVPKFPKDDKQSENSSFAFAEFDLPQKAADAIKAVHERFVDAFGYKISLRPAYIRPMYDGYGGSPQKNGTCVTDRSGNQGPSGHDTEQQERFGMRQSQSATQELNSLLSDQLVPGLNEREQISAGWPSLGLKLPDLMPDSQASDNPQLSIPQNLPASEMPPSLPNPKFNGNAHDHRGPVTRNTASEGIISGMPKVDGKATPAVKSKTPSPKKKKIQRMKKDEAEAEKPTQAKQRKDMLSNLRVKKAASNPGTGTLTTGKDQQAQDASKAASPDVSKELGSQKSTAKQPTVEREEATPTMPGEQSTGQTSPEHGTSAHARGLSSASLILSTDPTSYAQSEHSWDSPSDHQESPARTQDSPPVPTIQRAHVNSNGSVDVSKLDDMLSKEADLQESESEPISVASGQGAMQSSSNESSSAATFRGTVPTAPKQYSKIEVEEGGITLSNHGVEPSSDYKPEAYADAISNPEEALRPQRTDSFHIHGAPESEPRGETSTTGQVDGDISLSELEPLPSRPPLGALTKVNLGSPQPQKASSLQSKRALVKDPKLLIAVPRMVLPVRRKPQPQVTHIQGDETSKEPKISAVSPKAPRETGKRTDLVADAAQKLPSAPLTSPSTILGEPSPVPPTVQDEHRGSVMLTDNDRIVNKQEDMQIQMEDKCGARESMSASDSIATAEDDPFDPDTTTPQRFAAAMDNREKDAPVLKSLEQPAVQQKKAKKKKGKKNAQKPKTSQAESADIDPENYPQPDAAAEEEKPPMAQMVERPFVSDEGHALYTPDFTKHNHSSTKKGTGNDSGNQKQHLRIRSREDGTVERTYPSPSTYASASATSTPRPQALIIFSKESDGQAGIGESRSNQLRDDIHSLAADPSQELQAAASSEPGTCANVDPWAMSAQDHDIGTLIDKSEQPQTLEEIKRQAKKQIDEYCQENNKVSRERILRVLDALELQQPTDNGAPENREGSATNSRNRDIGAALVNPDPAHTIDDATRLAHYKRNDALCQTNDEASRKMIADMLDEISPELSNEERQAHHKAIDESCEANDEPSRNRITDMLEAITPVEDEGLDGSQSEDISDDKAQILPPPTAPLKERAQRMLPSRDASPATSSDGEPSKAPVAAHEANEPVPQGKFTNTKERLTASFPSTRRTSPERGRHSSVSPIKGLGLSNAGRWSDNLENISPSRLQPGKSLSYKEAVATSPTRPIRPGEVVELIPKENGQGGGHGQDYDVLRQSNGTNPWRVPSAELPWGTNQKPRGKSFAEASKPPK